MNKIYKTADMLHVAAPLLYAELDELTAGGSEALNKPGFMTGSGEPAIGIDDTSQPSSLYVVPPTDSEDGVLAKPKDAVSWFNNGGLIAFSYSGHVVPDCFVKPVNLVKYNIQDTAIYKVGALIPRYGNNANYANILFEIR